MSRISRLGLCAPLLTLVLACATASAAPRTAATAPAPATPAAKPVSKPPAKSSSKSPGKSVSKSKPVRKLPAKPAAPGLRARVVRRAATAVGAPSLSRITREVRDDCTGLVRWAYRASGVDLLEGSAAHMFSAALRARALRRGGRPGPGDLVFFRETYDRDGDQRRDDGITHVGVVARVERDGTVVFIHRASAGVKESRMNLRHPSRQRAHDGRVLNDFIRRASGGLRGRLTGEQFAGFASLEQLHRSRTGAAAVARAREPARRSTAPGGR